MDKKIIKNISSLFGIQGANYIIPLITLPYLVRVLGPEGYGVVGFSFAIMQYFCLLTDYGFNLSVTRKIAMNNTDKINISNIFWHVLICKIILAGFGFLILFVVVNVVGKLYVMSSVLYSSYLMVIGNVLFPIWLFQGKEKMGWIAIANITSRLLALPLIFLLIKNQNDEVVSALITSFSNIVAGLISLFFVYKNRWILIVKPRLSGIQHEFKDGWHVFISTAAISLYTTSTTVILGFITNNQVVGYYIAADKLRMAAQGLLSPITQSFYPRINLVMKKNENDGFRLIRKLLKYLSLFTFLISFSLFILAPMLIDLIYGNTYIRSVGVLMILAWLPFIIGLSNMFGIQTMLVLGLRSNFSKILITAGFLNLGIIFPLTYFLAEQGAAFSVLITEISVTLMMLMTILNKKIPIFGKSKNEI